MKISNHEPSKFLEYDGITPTPYFMENSTLGKLIPFSIFKRMLNQILIELMMNIEMD